MKVTLAQIGSGIDIADNLAQISAAATAARGAGADVVMFPEYSMYEKPLVDRTFAAVAEPLAGRFGSAIAALAADLGVAVVVGLVEANPCEPARPFNTIAVWSAKGALLGWHRKALLYDVGAFHESAFITPGDLEPPSTVRIGDTVCGLQTCYELRFPEISRSQVRAGATVLAVLSSWIPGPGKISQWTTLARARAIENMCHVVAVSQTAPISIGCSLAVGPDGAVLAELGEDPGQTTVVLDAAATRRHRQADARALRIEI